MLLLPSCRAGSVFLVGTIFRIYHCTLLRRKLPVSIDLFIFSAVFDMSYGHGSSGGNGGGPRVGQSGSEMGLNGFYANVSAPWGEEAVSQAHESGYDVDH